VHFPHNNALIITMLIGNRRVPKILVDWGNSVYILYWGALSRMEDILETARTMISPQTKSHLYGFEGNETHSLGTISLPIRADPYNVITEFYMMNVEPPTTRYSRDTAST